jgi:hypothetical protein
MTRSESIRSRPSFLLLAVASFAGLWATGDAAWAINRYGSTPMGCDAIRNALEREGAVIFRYPGRSGVPLYDRFVSDTARCSTGTSARRTTIPSRDGACPVLVCQQSWGHNNR